MVSVDTLFWFSVSDAFKVWDYENPAKTLKVRTLKKHQHPLRPTRRKLKRSFAVCCTYRRMAENGFAPPPPPREFCRHILSCRELKAESFKRCLHSVLRGVSL